MATVHFDAKGKVLGRLATQIASALRGKTTPDYRTDRLSNVHIVVTNVDLVRITGKKLKQKMYYHFSGYPGGLKARRMEEVDPKDRLRLAVKRMLPANTHRPRLMVRLSLSTSEEAAKTSTDKKK